MCRTPVISLKLLLLGIFAPQYLSVWNRFRQTTVAAYLGIWRHSEWWDAWVERWQPAGQTPCCCVRLPDSAPPSSWNSRSALWFGKPADRRLAGDQQREDTSPDEQGLEIQPHHLHANHRKHHPQQIRSSNEHVIIKLRQCYSAGLKLKIKNSAKNESFWCTSELYPGNVVLRRDQFGQSFPPLQATLFTRRIKTVLCRHKVVSREQLSVQTNKPSMLQHAFTMFDILKKQPCVRLKVMKQHFCARPLILRLVYTDEK